MNPVVECEQTELRIDDYVSARLDEQEMQALTEHIKNCLVCRTKIKRLREIQSLMQNAFTPEQSSQITERAEQWLESATPESIIESAEARMNARQAHPRTASIQGWLGATP